MSFSKSFPSRRHPLMAGLVVGASVAVLAAPVFAQDNGMPRDSTAPQQQPSAAGAASDGVANPAASSTPSAPSQVAPFDPSVPPARSFNSAVPGTPGVPADVQESVPSPGSPATPPGNTGAAGPFPSGSGNGYVTAQATPGAGGTTPSTFDNSRYSLLPGTSGGYVGLTIGRPEYDSSCGINPALACDDPDTSVRLYTGGMFNQNFGLELGYTDFGKADRAGGETHSRALDLSAVGRLPLASSFSVFGKVGASYGRTTVSADPSSGVTTGTESGFAPNVGAGISFDLNPQFAVLLEWDRTDLRFPGGEREQVSSNNLGVKYLF